MTAAEFRALVAQGPAVVMVAREDMLALLDERDALRQAQSEYLAENDALRFVLNNMRATQSAGVASAADGLAKP